MSRKFLPVLIFGFLGMILAITMIIVAPFEGNSEVESGIKEEPREEGELKVETTIERKLNEIRIKELKLQNATLEEAIEFLRLRSIEDDPEKEPARRGLSFVVRGARVISADGGGLDGFEEGGNPLASVISLTAEDVGIGEALDLICEEAELKWKVDEEVFKIVISPVAEPAGEVSKVEEDDPFFEEVDPFSEAE